MDRIRILGAAAALVGAISHAHAAALFSITVDVSGRVATAEFKTFEAMLDSLRTSELSFINPGYSGTQAASISINIRGLPVIATYPAAGSTLLTFRVPSLGISETFQGATRDLSQDMLEDFLKKNGNDILSRMGREFAKVSPVDPVAGNPASLMSQLVMMNYDAAFTDHATNIKPEAPAGTATRTSNLVGIAPRFGQYRQDGLTTQSLTVPLSYTFRNDLDPRRQVSFNLPVTFSDTEGAKSYHVGLGVSYRFPVSDDWALMPAITMAVAGSRDLGSLAAVGSAAITSSYLFRIGTFDLALGNMVGYYSTLKVASGDYSYNPKIKNTVFRNGLMLSHPAGEGMSVEYTLADTYFSGDALYVKHYDEFGISLGTNKSARSARSYMRGGATYLHSNKSKGFNAYFNYYF